MKVTEPYAVTCKCGRYIVGQAEDARHALERVRNEYHADPEHVRKVE